MSIQAWGTRNVGSEIAGNTNHPAETLGMNALSKLAPILGNVVRGHLSDISPHWSDYLVNGGSSAMASKGAPAAVTVWKMVSYQQNMVAGGGHDYWPAYYQLSQAMANGAANSY